MFVVDWFVGLVTLTQSRDANCITRLLGAQHEQASLNTWMRSRCSGERAAAAPPLISNVILLSEKPVLREAADWL